MSLLGKDSRYLNARQPAPRLPIELLGFVILHGTNTDRQPPAALVTGSDFIAKNRLINIGTRARDSICVALLDGGQDVNKSPKVAQALATSVSAIPDFIVHPLAAFRKASSAIDLVLAEGFLQLLLARLRHFGLL
jgi:hypothetical protein